MIMVRSYKSKTDRGQRDGSLMERGVKEVKEGKSIRSVAADLKIDRTTLSRYVKKADKQSRPINKYDMKPNYKNRLIFSEEEEKSLESYIIKCSKLFHGLGYTAVRKLACEYAVNLKKKVPQTWIDTEIAGKEWMACFMKRHSKLSLRSPEATSIGRAHGFNKTAVSNLFGIFKNTMTEYKFEPGSIYNLDESGITTVQAVPKVISQKGMKQVGQITAGERGVLVTVCCCVSATGQSLPPAMIFPRVNYKDYMVAGAPNGTLGLAAQSGWMNGELFPTVLKHFIKHMSCSKDKPAILLMDNHESHVSIEVIDIARENGLTILTFPPHCSHKMHPLDISVYGPLKRYYNRAVNEWNLSNPGKRITIYDLPSCFSRAYYQACSNSNIVEGFRKGGIFPLNSDIFDESEFLPSTVVKPPPINIHIPAHLDIRQTNSSSSQSETTSPETPTQASSPSSMNMPSTSGKVFVFPDTSTASTSELETIRPFPEMTRTLNPKRKGRPLGSAKVLTSTPEKEKLIELSAEKRKKSLKLTKKTTKTTKKSKVEENVEESDEESDNTYSTGSESNTDDFEELEDEQLDLEREPEIDDYVLVRLSAINSNKSFHYVGKVIDISENYIVSFYRKSLKAPGKFVQPVIEDISELEKGNIIMCLPKPLNTGGTKRVSAILHFPINLEKYKCQ